MYLCIIMIVMKKPKGKKKHQAEHGEGDRQSCGGSEDKL